MNGTITAANMRHGRTPTAGGLIRLVNSTDLDPRIPFEASELVGLSLADALGAQVEFGMMATRDGEIATRVRLAKTQPKKGA